MRQSAGLERRRGLLQRCRVFCMLCCVLLVSGQSQRAPAGENGVDGGMTEEEALQLGEEFGVVVDQVDEALQKELKMQKPEGVVVMEVIGSSPAEYAGIKVRAVIKEIDKQEVRTLLDFGRALKRALPTCNFTVGSYEPADPNEQGVGGLINFHFVGCKRD